MVFETKTKIHDLIVRNINEQPTKITETVVTKVVQDTAEISRLQGALAEAEKKAADLRAAGGDPLHSAENEIADLKVKIDEMGASQVTLEDKLKKAHSKLKTAETVKEFDIDTHLDEMAKTMSKEDRIKYRETIQARINEMEQAAYESDSLHQTQMEALANDNLLAKIGMIDGKNQDIFYFKNRDTRKLYFQKGVTKIQRQQLMSEKGMWPEYITQDEALWFRSFSNSGFDKFIVASGPAKGLIKFEEILDEWATDFLAMDRTVFDKQIAAIEDLKSKDIAF